MTAIEQLARSYEATLNSRRINEKTVSAANINVFNERSERLRHNFEVEFPHLSLGADFGLAEPLTVVVPLYTLTDRQVFEGPAGAREWQ